MPLFFGAVFWCLNSGIKYNDIFFTSYTLVEKIQTIYGADAIIGAWQAPCIY